ncbi:MAG: HRDC domain-containing protein [Rickettsiales bacterium]|jgi:ribonuclease D|nr:HRDC domain-containing protein [Rickettsiales bacterium]
MILADDDSTLGELCSQIRRSPEALLGLDTEFIRQKTYYPILCLVQGIFVGPSGVEEIFVIDVLERGISLEPFLAILCDRKIRKVMHSLGQDLDALQPLLGQRRLENIDDTQVMAEFCGYDYNIGYLTAVSTVTGESLVKNKSLQTSDWQRRPLSVRQLDYACGDVKYILQLQRELERKVRGCGNYEFYRNEMEYLQKHRERDYVLQNSWKRLKLRIHGKTMDRALLMKKLACWREARAMESNRIRGLILDDGALQALARSRPETMEDMRKLYQTHGTILNMKKSYKSEILELIREFVAAPSHGAGSYYTMETGFGAGRELDCLQEEIATLARDRRICPDRVVNKMDLIALLMGYLDRETILYGWKSELLAGLRPELFQIGSAAN